MGSFATGAKAPNWRVGIDNGLSTFMASIAMSGMLIGAGLLQGSRGRTYAQMLMDCEIFDIVYSMMKGILVNEETLALEAIHAVGPHGQFLAQKHTRKHMRELWTPKFTDRRPYEIRLEKGDNAPDWALEKGRQLHESHRPEPLDPEINREFPRIIAAVEKK
jgi:trimethylamine--corrinoid protein Co-methyltransferase